MSSPVENPSASPPLQNDESGFAFAQAASASPSAGVNWHWATYLATSWTWCIGMFLPVMLVRDFGLWGWLVFAIPNAVGAAAIGTTRYRYDGRSLLEKHQRAMVWFSIITVLFHVFFVAWMVRRLLGGPAVAIFVLAVLAFTVLIRCNRLTWGGWLSLAGSAAAACVYFALMGSRQPPQVAMPAVQLVDLLCLSPAIVLGFLLCPHMDLTLQHARQALPAAAHRPTYLAAFMGVFLLMIVFTLFYAQSLEMTLKLGHDILLPAAAAVALGLHMCIQAGWTTALHASQIIQRLRPRHLTRMLALFVLVIVLLLLLGRSIVPGSTLLGYDPGEVIYRMFIGFYGLVFPTYAWAAWVWRRRRTLSLAAWLGPTLIALPMFTAGFLTQRPLWIVPGVALVLLLPWLMLPRGDEGTGSEDVGLMADS